MINFVLNNKRKIRIAVFVLWSLISYLLLFFNLFGAHDVLWSVVFIFLLYISFHFMSLDVSFIKRRYMLLVLTSFTIIGISFLLISNWESNVWLILSVILLNTSLYALFDLLKMISFNSIWFFLRWWYVFTLLITISYSIALIGMFQKFPFTCQGLQDASNKLIYFVEKPFNFSVDNEDMVINWDKTWNIIDETVQGALLKVKDEEVIPDPTNDLSPIVWQFNEWKSSAIDQIMNQQESYSVGMCDMLLEEINTKYNKTEFRLSVILLSYLLLFWFVRVAIFIMSLIWFLSFKILYWLWFYKIEKVKKLVKEIK